jgi:CelD/BcsL family acetyltransferase involved in cellulose biosynthesis
VIGPSGPEGQSEVPAFDLVDRLEPLRDAWARLSVDGTNIFATWEWNELWWRHYGRGRELRVVLARSGDEVEAIVPLFAWSTRPLRVLRLLGHGHGDRLGPICDGDDSATAAHALQGALSTVPHDLFLGDWLAGDRGWAGALDGRVLRTTGYPILRLAGRSWDDLLAATSGRFRKSVRQSRNRLERSHAVHFRPTDETTLDRDLDDVFRLHGARFGRHQGCHFCGEYEPFQREFAALALERGWLRLLLLELDGDAVAAEFGFLFGNVYFAYQGGRDPAWDRESVGFVLELEMIRRVVKEGAAEFRFLGGEEAYKYRFPTEDPRLETVLVGATARGRLASATLATAWRLPGGEALLRRVGS